MRARELLAGGALAVPLLLPAMADAGASVMPPLAPTTTTTARGIPRTTTTTAPPATTTTLAFRHARASWYDARHELAFAHRTLAVGTRVEFRYGERTVTATCEGWGPQRYTGRDFDLGRDTFAALAPPSRGVIDLEWRPA